MNKEVSISQSRSKPDGQTRKPKLLSQLRAAIRDQLLLGLLYGCGLRGTMPSADSPVCLRFRGLPR